MKPAHKAWSPFQRRRSIFFTRHTMMLAVREGARQMAIEGATVDEAKTTMRKEGELVAAPTSP